MKSARALSGSSLVSAGAKAWIKKAAQIELPLASLLTAGIVCIHVARALNAGGLWRDDAAAVQLATMPQIKDVLHFFPHEAFPPLFPLALRSYNDLTGGSDVAWRVFGLAIGVSIIGALWVNMRWICKGAPLLSL